MISYLFPTCDLSNLSFAKINIASCTKCSNHQNKFCEIRSFWTYLHISHISPLKLVDYIAAIIIVYLV